MKTIAIVPIEFVHQAWEKCHHFLEPAFNYAQGDYSVEQAKVYLSQGTHQLLLFLEDSEIVGANIFSINNTPSARVFYIQATGGKTTKEHMDKMFEYAKSIGATKVKACCRKSVARLCRQRYNFKEIYTMIERQL
jgi:hypothetical protein